MVFQYRHESRYPYFNFANIGHEDRASLYTHQCLKVLFILTMIQCYLANINKRFLPSFSLPPVQWNVPRKTSVSGRQLPTPRDISLTVHTKIGQPTVYNPTLTMAMMQMGQFLDHDVIITPLEEGTIYLRKIFSLQG